MLRPCWSGPGILGHCYVPRAASGLRGGPLVTSGGRCAEGRPTVADIGEPQRVIEVQPLELPVPSEMPALEPEPVEEPVEVER
jgi:hypothetical protein